MESLAAEEREIGSEVLRLAEQSDGVGRETTASWYRARRAQADALLEADPREAQKWLAGELEELEARLSRLELAEPAQAAQGWRDAADLGMRLRWVLWLVDVVCEETTVDPLTLLHDQFDRVERASRELRAIEPRLAPPAGHLLEETERERLELFRARIERYRAAPEQETRGGPLDRATSQWLAATEAFFVEMEAIERGYESAEIEGELAAVRQERDRRLQRCRRELAACAPGEAAEFLHAALTDLLDEASTILSEGDSGHCEGHRRALELLRLRTDVLLDVLGPWRARLLRRGSLSAPERQRTRRDFKDLFRARRAIRAAETEDRVQSRLEETFGARGVHLFENLILVLIFALLGLVVFEWRLSRDVPRLVALRGGSPALGFFADLVVFDAIHAFNWIDLGFCVVFQIDFVGRWLLAGWGLSYFLRHFFVESLPALPYGFFFHHLGAMEEARAVIVVRLVRLRRLFTMRALVLIVLRVFRVLAFLARGLDRAVERFRPLLDRDILFFEQQSVEDAPEAPARRKALSLFARYERAIDAQWEEVPAPERIAPLRAAARVAGAEARICGRLTLAYRRASRELRGDVHVDRVIREFLDCDVAHILSMVGRDGVERIFRWLRFLDAPLIRSAPGLRRIAPEARRARPAEAVSAAVRGAGKILQDILGGLRFWGDLSGITTGPQVLDRVGSAVVAASRRPAMRLILIGGLFLLAKLLAAPFPALEQVALGLFRVLGLPLLILGSICLVFLFLGRWFKRISGEAMDLYLRTADAQFYPLIKAGKYLRSQEDLKFLYRSVLRPEIRLRGGDGRSDEEWIEFLAAPLRERARFMPGRHEDSDPAAAAFGEERDTITLLYRDFLDSPVLHRSDDKASVQLLGNLSLQSLRHQTLRLSLRELRRLEKLDLDKGSLLALGPYFWFRFITESLAIETAKLIMEYNATCMPLDQLHLAAPEAREALAMFLEEHRGAEREGRERRRGEPAGGRSPLHLRADFTAFDFLAPTEQSDGRVRERYGEEVLDALRRDRRAVVRDIFGTRPYHLLPKHRRAFNPYRLYRKYLGGARVFLLPFVFLFLIARLVVAAVARVWDLVEEVLGRRRASRSHLSRIAGFDVAVRKINRMRKPLFMEALRLRALVDVEYLDLTLPGQEDDPDVVSWHDDLDAIGALDSDRRPVAELRARVLSDLRRFRSFLAARGWSGPGLDDLLGRLDPSGELLEHRGEVVRALVTAYVTDHEGMRSRFEAPRWCRRLAESALGNGANGSVRRSGWGERCLAGLLSFLSSVRRRRRLFRRYAPLEPRCRSLSGRTRRAVEARFALAGPEAEERLEAAVELLGGGREKGEQAILSVLERAACDYRLWTRKLITVRAIQALTLLDLSCYRDMVWRVGEYGEERDGSPAPARLEG